MRSLRIAQESDKTKFIFYWEKQCPITNQENFWEFVEFRRKLPMPYSLSRIIQVL